MSRNSPTGVYLFLEGGEHANSNPKLAIEEVDIHGVSLPKLLELVDSKEAYWGSGASGGTLYFTEFDGEAYLPRSPKLLVDYHVDHGFKFQWIVDECIPTKDESIFWIALNRKPSSTDVPVEFFCQTSFWFPPTAFVDGDIAKKVIATFVRSKGKSRSRSVHWRKQVGTFSDPSEWKLFVP